MNPKLVIAGGIITLISFLITAYIGYSLHKGGSKFTFKQHVWMARISIIFGLTHGAAALILILGQ